VVKKLPLEYAVEMNRLIDHEMEGSIGWRQIFTFIWFTFRLLPPSKFLLTP
jgi:hypothetical protein